MSFDTLSIELQNILMANHSYMSKWLLFFSMLFLSVYYLFIVLPDMEQTKFFTRAIIRVFFMTISAAYLVASPMIFILQMTPEYSFYNFVSLYYIIYSILIFVGLVMIFIDMIRYTPFVLLKWAGFDLGDRNANEIVKSLTNLRFFIKMNKKNARRR